MVSCSSSVSFFLGYSKHPINSSNSCSSTDIESDTDCDCYSKADADGYSKPINIKASRTYHSAALITPPSDPASLVNASSDSIESIANFAKAHALPPSPPVSPVIAKQTLPISPYSLLRSAYFEIPISPRPAPNNDLIACNLGPISPFQLSCDSFADDEDIDDFDLEDDEEYEEPSVSPEFLVGHESEIISHLNLEEDPVVVDKFHPQTLLADPERPFIPSSPVYDSVHELLITCYPHIEEGSQTYFYHLGRLMRNRDKLRALSDSMECYDQQVRKKRSSEMSFSRCFEQEEKRFRARR